MTPLECWDKVRVFTAVRNSMDLLMLGIPNVVSVDLRVDLFLWLIS